MLEMQVTKEMWAEWKSNPVTNAFMREIHNRRENVKEYVVSNSAKGDELIQLIGAARALSDILNIEFQGEEENDSNTGV